MAFIMTIDIIFIHTKDDNIIATNFIFNFNISSSSVAKVMAPVIINFMLEVPDASLETSEICSEIHLLLG